LNREEQKLAISNKIEKISGELNEQVTEYKDLGRNVAIIGGILVSAYALIRMINSDDDTIVESPKKEEDSLLFSTLKGVAISVALALVKDKLIDFLSNSVEEDEK
jgi:hypothetical protein